VEVTAGRCWHGRGRSGARTTCGRCTIRDWLQMSLGALATQSASNLGGGFEGRRGTTGRSRLSSTCPQPEAHDSAQTNKQRNFQGWWRGNTGLSITDLIRIPESLCVDPCPSPTFRGLEKASVVFLRPLRPRCAGASQERSGACLVWPHDAVAVSPTHHGMFVS
jgi:hypothetical protein